MSRIRGSIQVDVPVRTAYGRWTQFEEFPLFMDGVEKVRRLDSERLYWIAEVGWRRRDWRARITELVPDRVIAWRSEHGTLTGGRVAFEPLGEAGTRIELDMEFVPEGIVERAGDALGLVRRKARGDLRRFKERIEGRLSG